MRIGMIWSYESLPGARGIIDELQKEERLLRN